MGGLVAWERLFARWGRRGRRQLAGATRGERELLPAAARVRGEELPAAVVAKMQAEMRQPATGVSAAAGLWKPGPAAARWWPGAASYASQRGE